MLDGQGADEQLAGYHTFYTARLGGLLARMSWVTLAREVADVRRVHGASAKQLLGYALSPVLPEVVRQGLRKLTRRPAVAVPEWLDLQRLRARPIDPFLVAGSKATTVQALSRVQILATSLPMLLHWEDRDSMAHAIEARVPFLDYRLVELALGLPDSFKIRGATTKVVLRDAMRGILPESIRVRMDKIGFATAETQWMRQEAPGAFRTALHEAVEASSGVLRPSAMGVLDGMIAGRRTFSFLPWRMICFGAWMKRFDVRIQ
jgi:asparagine synthase (glutamine-hydrolysing)